jgi:hypothetical protein
MHMHRITEIVPAFSSRIKMSVTYKQGDLVNERSVYYGNEIGSKLVLLSIFLFSFFFFFLSFF